MKTEVLRELSRHDDGTYDQKKTSVQNNLLKSKLKQSGQRTQMHENVCKLKTVYRN